MAQSVPPRTLFVFDFDHTLIDDNTDTFILKITQDPKIKSQFKTWHTVGLCWTECMRRLFKELHSQTVSPNEIVSHMQKIKIPVQRHRMLHFLSKQPGIELIIISDSNTVFIDSILKSHGIDSYFKKVYTNPAKFNPDGLLEIQEFHANNACDLSPSNMCKEQILRDHIKSMGVNRSELRVVYLGDGSGDFCAASCLSAQDIVVARKGYNLASKLSTFQSTGQLNVTLVLSEMYEDLESFVSSLFP